MRLKPEGRLLNSYCSCSLCEENVKKPIKWDKISNPNFHSIYFASNSLYNALTTDYNTLAY
jgi:hypothetical protein